MKIFWVIVSLVIVHLSAPFAGDAADRSPTMADVMLLMTSHKDLPEYCQVMMTKVELFYKFKTRDVPAQFAKVRDKWIRTIGKNNWLHFHHYCFGIQKLNRFLRMTEKPEEKRRKGMLGSALAEFEYMRKRADRSFPLWPQLFMYESQIYFQLGQPVKAQRAMQQAVKYQKRRKSRR
jgi:hypothetical protein